MPSFQGNMRSKIRFLSVVYILLFVGLLIKLFYWQIIKGKELSKQALSQYNSSKITEASRGNILAKDGSFLAIKTETWTIYANTRMLKDTPRAVSQKLAQLLVQNEADKTELLEESSRLESLLSKDGAYIPLKQRVSANIKKNIESLRIDGLGFENNETRYYPEASTSAQLLGFVGKEESGENIGYFGLEGYYNLPLSGKSGFTLRQKDAQGDPILLGGSRNVSATSGVDLITNIDKRIQILIEQKLKSGVEKYGALSGSVMVMEPFSGEVMAMAGFPSFDPAKYWEYSDTLFKNPVISDTFEPGSIFKVIVMASGLDAGVVTPETQCDICGAPLRLDKYLIKTWNNEYRDGITMTDVIVHSDNVGMSFVGQKLGTEKMFEYLDRFGIGRSSGIDLQGEAVVPLRKKGSWNVVDLATASFGQGVVVSGVQMVRATAAIANGGYLVTPQVVKAIRSEGWEEVVKKDKPTQVISKKAAEATAQMMVQAVDGGEAKWTKVPNFVVAGKTGTAQIAVEGHYDSTRTNHSFVGFAPVQKPKFVMLVTLKSPQSSPWASETAAPLWFDIAKELFPYLGVAPEE